MDSRDIVERVKVLEYHMKLMAEALETSEYEFNKIILKNNLSEQEVVKFYALCEEMNKVVEEQKAEGFLNFHPLFQEFSTLLPAKLNPREVVLACLRQKIFVPLMSEFRKSV